MFLIWFVEVPSMGHLNASSKIIEEWQKEPMLQSILGIKYFSFCNDLMKFVCFLAGFKLFLGG